MNTQVRVLGGTCFPFSPGHAQEWNFWAPRQLSAGHCEELPGFPTAVAPCSHSPKPCGEVTERPGHCPRRSGKGHGCARVFQALGVRGASAQLTPLQGEQIHIPMGPRGHTNPCGGQAQDSRVPVPGRAAHPPGSSGGSSRPIASESPSPLSPQCLLAEKKQEVWNFI